MTPRNQWNQSTQTTFVHEAGDVPKLIKKISNFDNKCIVTQDITFGLLAKKQQPRAEVQTLFKLDIFLHQLNFFLDSNPAFPPILSYLYIRVLLSALLS